MSQAQPSDAPAAFIAAMQSLRGAAVRHEVKLAEVPAPRQVSPFAVALAGEIIDELPTGVVAGPGRRFPAHEADGRFVLLHDPAGQASWNGEFRVVVMARAEMDPDLASDPMLPTVVWDWLDETLRECGAREHTRAGTVTRVLSEGFGVIDEKPHEVEVEIRASWTPDDLNLGSHLSAWSQLLCHCAGLEPRLASRPVLS